MPDVVPGAKVKPNYDTTTLPGVVIDKVTKLQWQRVAGTDLYNGDQAIAYCDALTLAGFSDWRIPTKIELESIVAHSDSLPSIDSAFPDTPFQTGFWAVDGYIVEFLAGTSDRPLPGSGYYVRCVRTEAPVPPGTPGGRYIVNADDDTVTDTRTGLIWQRTVGNSAFAWTAAKDTCNQRGFGFRLPTLKELLTLFDPLRWDPYDKKEAFDPVAFPKFPGYYFWSATPYSTDRAYYFGSYMGDTGTDTRDQKYSVLCVTDS